MGLCSSSPSKASNKVEKINNNNLPIVPNNNNNDKNNIKNRVNGIKNENKKTLGNRKDSSNTLRRLSLNLPKEAYEKAQDERRRTMSERFGIPKG